VNNASRRFLVGAAVVVAALMGTLVGCHISGTNDIAASDRLQAANFVVLTPRSLPAGSELINSEVRPHSDGTCDVDLWYRLPDGHRVHIWETSRADSALDSKNPLELPGSRRTGTSGTWLEGSGFSGRVVTWTARIGPVLVSVDGPLSPEALFFVADSVR
jgi:hypothetical protein